MDGIVMMTAEELERTHGDAIRKAAKERQSARRAMREEQRRFTERLQQQRSKAGGSIITRSEAAMHCRPGDGYIIIGGSVRLKPCFCPSLSTSLSLSLSLSVYLFLTHSLSEAIGWRLVLAVPCSAPSFVAPKAQTIQMQVYDISNHVEVLPCGPHHLKPYLGMDATNAFKGLMMTPTNSRRDENQPSALHRHDSATVSHNPPPDAAAGSHTALPNTQITATLCWPSFSLPTCMSETFPSSRTFGTVNQGTRRRTRTGDPRMMKSPKARQREPLLTPRAPRVRETMTSTSHPLRYLYHNKRDQKPHQTNQTTT
jgi:hypothetical protein